MDKFISMVDEFVQKPEASAHQEIRQLFKTQVHWTDKDFDVIKKRFSHWELAAKNKMVKTILELLGSDEILLQELDATIQENYNKLANATESFYKDVCQVVHSLQSATERRKEANDDVLIDFVAQLKDEQATANASEIQKKRAEMQPHYVNCLMKVLLFICCMAIVIKSN